MKSLSLLLVVLLFSYSIQPGEDAKFIRLVDNFIEKYLQQYPEWATSLGDHRYDHLLNGYSLKSIENEIWFMSSYLDSLKAISPENLDQVNSIDFQIMKHSIEKRLFRLTVLKGHEWNPLHYNVGDAIYTLLARDFAPMNF